MYSEIDPRYSIAVEHTGHWYRYCDPNTQYGLKQGQEYVGRFCGHRIGALPTRRAMEGHSNVHAYEHGRPAPWVGE